MPSVIAFIACVLIWGTTWYAIKLQLGDVPPEWSLVWRFGMASLILFAICALKKRPLRFTRKQHGWLFLLGSLMFCINYLFVYWGTGYLTSGLVAVIFSLMVIFNIGMARIFLGEPIQPRMVVGATAGTAGLILIFWNDMTGGSGNPGFQTGLALCLAGAFFASLGNTVAASQTIRKIPILSVNAWGMAYGTLCTALVAVAAGIPPAISTDPQWIFSLLHLALLGSVAAFGLYLWLLDKIGVGAAAYTQVVIPLVALGISTVTEGYTWTVPATIGLACILGGNIVIMRGKRKKKA